MQLFCSFCFYFESIGFPCGSFSFVVVQWCTNWKGARAPAWKGAKAPAWKGARAPAWKGARAPAWKGARAPGMERSKSPNMEWSKGPRYGEEQEPQAWKGAKAPAWKALSLYLSLSLSLSLSLYFSLSLSCSLSLSFSLSLSSVCSMFVAQSSVSCLDSHSPFCSHDISAGQPQVSELLAKTYVEGKDGINISERNRES